MPGNAIAEYFQIDPAIVKHVPDLLQDLWALGSDPDWIAQSLEGLGLASGARVLDLGSGKGAVAITLAERLKVHVHGVDMLEAFVVDARHAARERGVADLCQFTRGDLRESVEAARDFDVALFVAVGDVLGAMGECVSALRRAVRPGGYMVIDDAFAIGSEPIDFPGYANLLAYGETVRQLTLHGDSIERERQWRAEDVKAQNEEYTAWIAERAKRLSQLYPEHARYFDAYVAREREESRLLETQAGCATWVLRRADMRTGEE
jgi:cyclopropane fatty-acyl-phospholipid synthase-like methyltransferase